MRSILCCKGNLINYHRKIFKQNKFFKENCFSRTLGKVYFWLYPYCSIRLIHDYLILCFLDITQASKLSHSNYTDNNLLCLYQIFWWDFGDDDELGLKMINQIGGTITRSILYTVANNRLCSHFASFI